MMASGPELLLRINPENSTHSGDGTRVTAVADVSGYGNDGVEYTAGQGPMYRATLWDGQPCFEFAGSNAAALKFSGGNLVPAMVGQDRPFTIIMLGRIRDRVVTTTWYWSLAKSTLGSRYLSCRHQASTSHRYELISQSASGTAPTVTSTQQWHGGAEIIAFRRGDGQFAISVDNEHETAQATAHGDLEADQFVIGGWGTSTPGISGDWLCREFRVYRGYLSDAEVDSICSDMATQYGVVKEALGATLGPGKQTIVVPLWLEQSNGQGNAEALPYPETANTDCLMLGHNGFVRHAVEPTADNTDYTYQMARSYTAPGLCGFAVQLAKELATLEGSGNKILIVPCGLNSSRADQWATGKDTSPQVATTLYGAAWHRITEALKAPNAVLAPAIIVQGEAEAGDATSAAADAWDATVGPILDKFASDFSGRSWKAQKFLIVETDSAVARTYIPNVRARQEALAAARADTEIYDPATEDDVHVTLSMLHYDTPAYVTIGTELASRLHNAT